MKTVNSAICLSHINDIANNIIQFDPYLVCHNDIWRYSPNPSVSYRLMLLLIPGKNIIIVFQIFLSNLKAKNMGKI